MLICYDCWFPEAFRAARPAGADFVCVPTNWVPISNQDPAQRSMATVLCQAAAHSNGVHVLAADRIGVERRQPFVGQSVIESYTGWPLAGRAPATQRQSLHAQVCAQHARDSRTRNPYNDPLKDRRPDIYEPLARG